MSDNDKFNDIIVRGGNSQETLFIVDNIEIPSINQLALSDTTGGLVSMIDNKAIQQMTLHTRYLRQQIRSEAFGSRRDIDREKHANDPARRSGTRNGWSRRFHRSPLGTERIYVPLRAPKHS